MDENYWQLGTWGRIPVAMHWTVLLTFAWMYLVFQTVPATLLGSAVMFFVMAVHEMGHVAVLRRRKLPIDSITFFGVHGSTSHVPGSRGTEIAVAWAGLGAQLLLLAGTLAVAPFVNPENAVLAWAWGVAFISLTKLNVFLMVIALIPIGPFDGRTAWSVFGYMKGAARRRKREKQERLLHPERALSPERRRELEDSSERAAADLIGKLSGRKDGDVT